MTDPDAWRTDPRERLLAAIDQRWAYSQLGVTPEQLVDAYAHHLAEQIRAAWKNHNPKKPGNVTMLSALNAADLIDPETGEQR